MVVLMRRRCTRRGLLLLLSVTIALSAARSTDATRADEVQVVEIVAERFSFTPSEFRVKAGVPVEIRLRSDDTNHGFRILGTDINITIPKRGKGVTTVTFQPPSAGRYQFECSKLCGAGHSFMRGTLIAE
jgi:cytochrome c oxidase subunit 2